MAIEVLCTACDLIDDAIGLPARVARDVADALFDLTFEISKATLDLVFVHDWSLFKASFGKRTCGAVRRLRMRCSGKIVSRLNGMGFVHSASDPVSGPQEPPILVIVPGTFAPSLAYKDYLALAFVVPVALSTASVVEYAINELDSILNSSRSSCLMEPG